MIRAPTMTATVKVVVVVVDLDWEGISQTDVLLPLLCNLESAGR